MSSLKTTINPVDICTKISTVPLIKHHYSYIYGARYYTPPKIYHYISLALYTLLKNYLLTYPSKYLLKISEFPS